MSLTELLPIVNQLTDEEKQKIHDMIAAELPNSCDSSRQPSAADYLYWSHFEADEAAAILRKLLEEDSRKLLVHSSGEAYHGE